MRRASLDDCRERVDRANENIVNLQREIAIFRNGRPYRTIREPDSDPLKLAFRVVSVVAPHDRRVNPEACKPKPQFPVFVWRTKNYESKLLAQIRRVSDSAAALIKRLQPCEGQNGGRDAFLAMFHELDVIDKHRLLTALMIRVNLGEPIAALKPGAYFAIRFPAPPPKMDVDIDLPIEIAFDEPRAFQNKPVIPTLAEISEFTSHTLRLFADEFIGDSHESHSSGHKA